MSWHLNSEYVKYLNDFHDKFARQPDMKEAKRIHTKVMHAMENKLKEKSLCVRLEYTGSAYEGLRVGRSLEADGKDDIEFDIMIIIGVNMVTAVPRSNSYANLKADTNHKSISILTDCVTKSIILPELVARKYFGALQIIFNNMTQSDSTDLKDISYKLRRHGPAIQLDVCNKNSLNRLSYSVDLVPTFHNNNANKNEYFVAKPGPSDMQTCFRRSFSVEERDKMESVDVNNGCRRRLIRVLKMLFKREPTFQSFQSYHIKTVTLHLIDQIKGNEFWQEGQIFARFIDFLKLFNTCLEKKKIPQYFLPKGDIFPDIKDDCIGNIRCRIDRLLASEIRMKKFIDCN